jgi:hypothetical protein
MRHAGAPGWCLSRCGPMCCSTSRATRSAWARSARGRAQTGSRWPACGVGGTSRSPHRPVSCCGAHPRTGSPSAARRSAAGPRTSGPDSRRSCDDHWRSRFGIPAVDRLDRVLRSVFEGLSIDPPAYLPVIHPAQNGKVEPPPSDVAGTASPRLPRSRGNGSLSHFSVGCSLPSRSTSKPDHGSPWPSARTRCACSTTPGHACATCPV